VLAVEPRRYRFRVLNGCNARFLILKLAADPLAARPVAPSLPFWVIGADGGFLPAPARLDQLLLAPAERADLVVDFTGLPAGSAIYLVNEGPDEPFGGLPAPFADPATTGQVMKFEVVPLASTDTSRPPDQLPLPAFRPLGSASATRQVSLNELDSAILPDVGPAAAMLGTRNPGGTGNPLAWKDTVTENPAAGAVEVWEIHNFTEDAHPIHIHQVQFQVLDRQPIDGGDARPPEAHERGFKDTVTALPDEITRVKALFDLPGSYVWHCHILEHEDNEMMRPFQVGPVPPELP
jgi:FtsP/CotA-like multicopper oxidase with cupredoxin domain